MTEPPRKKRFQIHLSTAIVLMLAAGGLIWANTRMNIGNPHKQLGVLLGFSSDGKVIEWIGYAKGYPFVFEEPTLVNEDSVDALEKESPGVPIGTIGVRTAPLLADVAIALAVLFAIWFISESWIRRRAVRKEVEA